MGLLEIDTHHYDLRVNKKMVFESMVVELCKSGNFFFVVVVYRSPSGNVQEFSDFHKSLNLS
jgi:hypothetical protein